VPETPPLDGITVVSVEQAVAAPLATRHLAELGARVIKVERPDGGDFARRYDTAVRGHSSYFVWLNRTKESVTLDLSAPDGRAVLDGLVAQADVVVQNLAPATASRLGLDPPTLAARYPRLIACGISGYGTGGPMSQRKAYDLLIQADAGFLEVTGSPEQRVKAGISIADIAAGMYTYSAVLAALVRRGVTGRGCPIEVAMLDALAEWMSMPLLYAHHSGASPGRAGASHATIAPYGPFPTADGEVLLAVQHEREWRTLCTEVLAQPGLVDDVRFASNSARVAHRRDLDVAIGALLAGLTSAEVTDALEAAGIANAAVRTLDEVWAHPQLRARGRFASVATRSGPVEVLRPPVEFPGGTVFGPVPALGEHTARCWPSSDSARPPPSEERTRMSGQRDEKLTVGFVGLGDMGGAMAERILEGGFPLTVCDLRAEAVSALTALGAVAADSPGALASESDVVLLCVVDDAQVLALVRDHLVAGLRPGSVLVISSSVRPDTVHEVRRLLGADEQEGVGVEVLDAPVSGSRPAVAAGTLTLMVGGEASTVENVRPVLETFAGRIFHVGGPGAGQAMKIANNLMLHLNHFVALEALRFARSQGISEESLIEVVNTGSGRSWVTETWGLIDDMFRDHPQAGTTGIYDMMVKEMWNAVLLARSTGTWLPLAGLGVQVGRPFLVERERELGIVPALERR
jgi:formyl-CoA transferase